MNSLYTNELRQFINTRDWPRHLAWEIVEFDDCLKLRLFRDNINGLQPSDKLRLAPLINDTLSKVRDQGVPIYTWVVKGNGRERV